MTLTPQEQLRGSLALGVLEQLRAETFWLAGIDDVEREAISREEADAIEPLIEIVRRLAEPDGAAPPSDRANGRSKSGGGAAYKEE